MSTPEPHWSDMYLSRVVLENIRGFPELHFDLQREDNSYAGWTVVTGENASGKTSFIKAVTLAVVGPDAARALQTSLRGWVRSGCTEARVSVQLVPGSVDKPVTGHPYETPFWSELQLARRHGPEVSVERTHRFAPKGKKGPIHGPWAENPKGWFSAGYGPFRRLYGASSDAQRVMSGPAKIARYATLFREDATLGESEQWLTTLHHKKLEGKERERLILEKVTRLLDNEFMRNDFAVERVDSDSLWLRSADNTVLPLIDMSEGYRAAIAMLIDIVRFMVDTYGHDDLLQEKDGFISVTHPGVVLIDEVDAHLHPEWQRQIGFWLKSRFPAVQFIVTSHSPLICQAADSNGLFFLPRTGSGQIPRRLTEIERAEILASKPDAILTGPAFGMAHTRSPVAVEASIEHSRLRAKQLAGKLTKAEAEKAKQLKLFLAADAAFDDGVLDEEVTAS